MQIEDITFNFCCYLFLGGARGYFWGCLGVVWGCFAGTAVVFCNNLRRIQQLKNHVLLNLYISLMLIVFYLVVLARNCHRLNHL